MRAIVGGHIGTVAIYLRLSLEDEITEFVGKKYESESIANQRQLTRNHILGMEELEGYDIVEFIDDGRSGTNMNRPGLQDMIKAANQGLINVIVVKDLSRIGRNYIEVGNILEQEFPSLDIRVIAINDNFDSDDYEGTTAGMAVIIKMMMYDMYSKQLSSKVKQVQYQLMEQGKFVNTPPYGYKVLPEQKHQLVIDDEAARIVRLIFKKIIAGCSTADVALYLNEKGVPTPTEYKGIKKQHCRYRKNTMWTHPVIVEIIRNEKYRGAMVYHKRKKHRVGDRYDKRTAKETWLIIEDTHEPIVTKEEFLQAQDMLRKVKKSKKKKSTNDNVFVCPYCGYKLQKTYGKDTYYSCSHVRYTGNEECKKIYWSKSKLEKVLCHLFSAQAKLYLTETVKQETRSINKEVLKKKKSSLQYLKQSYASLNLKKSELYDKYKDGFLDREGFIKEKERYTDESIRVKKQIEEAEAELQELQIAIQELEVRKADEEHMNHLLNLPEDRMKEIMYTFIDEVQIFDSETIRVKWNFSDGLQMVS